MIKKVVTLGEILLRLSTLKHERFVQSNSVDITYGGSEANVAASLSNYELESIFLSKVPDNSIGQAGINHLRRYGINTNFIVRGGNRLGIYFLESGSSIRASQIIYDREGSSMTDFSIDEFDIDAALKGAHWFHTSIVTAALGEKAVALIEAILKKAKDKGITTSLDINYRKKLWTKEKATEILSRLCQYVDVCIGADITLGFYPNENNVFGGKITAESYKELFLSLKKRFGFKFIATSLSESHNASDSSFSALVYDGVEFYTAKRYDVHIIDKVGAEDSFSSGLIYGLVSGMSTKDAGEFAAAAGVIKHTISGDFNHVTLSEVLDLVESEGGI